MHGEQEKALLIRLDLHVHTCHSIDSTTNPRNVAQIAQSKGLDGIAVTDHNTIRGGLEAAKHSKHGVRVIVGSEIKTDIGDMICLFLNEEIRSTNALEVIDLAKLQGGITVLPHPFRSNRDEKFGDIFFEVAAKVDAIEVLNGRTCPSSNKKALLLAQKLNKPAVAGSDSHFDFEVGNGRTLFPPSDREEELKQAILEDKTSVEGIPHPFCRSVPLYLASFLNVTSRRIKQRISSKSAMLYKGC